MYRRVNRQLNPGEDGWERKVKKGPKPLVIIHALIGFLCTIS